MSGKGIKRTKLLQPPSEEPGKKASHLCFKRFICLFSYFVVAFSMANFHYNFQEKFYLNSEYSTLTVLGCLLSGQQCLIFTSFYFFLFFIRLTFVQVTSQKQATTKPKSIPT